MIECITYRWSPAIGDPTIFGWLTVALYLAAAGLCFLRAKDGFSSEVAALGPQRFFWISLSLLLSLLAINKQFDVQSLFTTIGRCAAQAGGWYETRSDVQRTFVGIVALAALAVGTTALWLMRGFIREIPFAAAGFFILIIFVVLRAASFHHIDNFINTGLMGLRLNWLVEMGALGLIIYGAIAARNDATTIGRKE
ncbi:MAG: isopropylmalate isomerase [Marinicaulis sp.]|nr:isopropylmalate isomerase [Marinicaulis sp.]